MSRLKIYDNSLSKEKIELMRAKEYLQLSTEEKMKRLFNLIAVSRMLNGGKPLKEPQGKGIIIKRPTNN